MLQHHPKLKKLATTNGKVDGRKIRGKAFLNELSRVIGLNPPDPKMLGEIFNIGAKKK